MSEIKEAACVAVSEALVDAYDCERVWEAWGVNTMGPDDFIPIWECPDRIDEVVRAAISPIVDALQRAESGDFQQVLANYRQIRRDLLSAFPPEPHGQIEERGTRDEVAAGKENSQPDTQEAIARTRP